MKNISLTSENSGIFWQYHPLSNTVQTRAKDSNQYLFIENCNAKYQSDRFHLLIDGNLDTPYNSELLSDQYLLVSINGDLVNRGKISAPGVTLVADRLENRATGEIISTESSHITTKKSLENSGLIVAKSPLSIDGNQVENKGSISSDTVNINCHQLNNNKGIISASAMDLSGSVSNENGQIRAKSLQANLQKFDNSGGQLLVTGKTGTTSLSASQITNHQGGKIVVSNPEFNLSSQSIQNQRGEILHGGAGKFNLTNVTSLNNEQGKIHTNGYLISGNKTTINNAQQGQLTAKKMNLSGAVDNKNGHIETENLQASLQKFNNSGGQLLVTGKTDTTSLNASQIINQQGGKIAVNNAEFNLSSQSIQNQRGEILHGGADKFNLTNITSLNNEQGKIHTNGCLISGNKTTINNTQQGQLTAKKMNLAGAVDNKNGHIETENLQASLQKFDNSGGQLLVTGKTGTTSLSASQIINQQGGKIAVNNSEFNLSSQSIQNQEGKVLHGGNGNLNLTNVASLNNKQGKIQTNSHLVSGNKTTINNTQGAQLIAKAMDLSGFVNNEKGYIQTESLQANLQKFDNKGGQLLVTGKTGTTSLNAGEINNKNRGKIVVNNARFNLRSPTIHNQSGEIAQETEGEMNLCNTGLINNNEAGLLQSKGHIVTNEYTTINNSQKGKIIAKTVNISGTMNNKNGIIQTKNGQIKLKSAFDNTGGEVRFTGIEQASLHADTIVNRDGGQVNARNPYFSLSANKIDNQSGKIQHAGYGHLNLHTKYLDNYQGEVRSNGHLKDHNKAIIYNFVGVLSSNQMSLPGKVDNAFGSIQAGTLNANLDGVLDNNYGKILLTGDQDSVISATAIHNSHGDACIRSNGNVTLKTRQLDNKDTGKLTSERNLTLLPFVLRY